MGTECTANGSYRLSFHTDARFLPYFSEHFSGGISDTKPRSLQSRRAVGRSQIVLGEDVEIVPVELSEVSGDVVPPGILKWTALAISYPRDLLSTIPS